MFLVIADTRVGESLHPNFGDLKPHDLSGLLIFVDIDWLLCPKIMYLPVISLLINLA